MTGNHCAHGLELYRGMMEAAEAVLAGGDRSPYDKARTVYVEHMKACDACGTRVREPKSQGAEQ